MAQSGDKDPFDNRSTGFDAILENPQFAGADTSFFIRQAVPLVGGGGVALSGRNGLLASLRSSKDMGQSNFVNPGLLLLGIGADADLKSVPISAGDCFVLCSDGMSNYIEHGELERIVAMTWYRRLPETLIALANDRGGDDNITVVVGLVSNAPR